MQLHSRARVTSQTLEGLLKVTHHKLCKCSRFSTFSSLVSITHPSICLPVFVYQLVSTFIVCFSSQCTYSKKVTSLWGRLLGFAHLLFNHATKNFLMLRSNYTTEVYLVMHELFLSKIRQKCNCLVNFCTTNLPTMHAYVHAHCCLLFNAVCETWSCDWLLHIKKMLIVRWSWKEHNKVGFPCSVLFYSFF